MSSLLVFGQLPDLAKKTPEWLAAGEASSKAAVRAATRGARGGVPSGLPRTLCQTKRSLVCCFGSMSNEQTKDNEAVTLRLARREIQR
jgi:hypothetical protein